GRPWRGRFRGRAQRPASGAHGAGWRDRRLHPGRCARRDQPGRRRPARAGARRRQPVRAGDRAVLTPQRQYHHRAGGRPVHRRAGAGAAGRAWRLLLFGPVQRRAGPVQWAGQPATADAGRPCGHRHRRLRGCLLGNHAPGVRRHHRRRHQRRLHAARQRRVRHAQPDAERVRPESGLAAGAGPGRGGRTIAARTGAGPGCPGAAAARQYGVGRARPGKPDLQCRRIHQRVWRGDAGHPRRGRPLGLAAAG
ncbi:hypothetical protein HMPREF0005_05970, partial [Achromobacter xylosoxidans C54]